MVDNDVRERWIEIPGAATRPNTTPTQKLQRRFFDPGLSFFVFLESCCVTEHFRMCIFSKGMKKKTTSSLSETVLVIGTRIWQKSVDRELFKPFFEGFPRQISRFGDFFWKVREILHKSYIFYVTKLSVERKRRSWSSCAQITHLGATGSTKFLVFFKGRAHSMLQDLRRMKSECWKPLDSLVISVGMYSPNITKWY